MGAEPGTGVGDELTRGPEASPAGDRGKIDPRVREKVWFSGAGDPVVRGSGSGGEHVIEPSSRLAAFGNQLVQAHIALRERLEALSDGLADGARVTDLWSHCLSFCAALERHHTAEDDGVFPVLAREHPELRPVLDELGRDHRIVSDALAALGELGDAEPEVLQRELAGVAALTGRLGETDAELITRATTGYDA